MASFRYPKPRLSAEAYALLTADLTQIGTQPKSLRWWADYLGYNNIASPRRGFLQLVEAGHARTIPHGRSKTRKRYILIETVSSRSTR